MLLFGQRLAKDYDGARTIVILFYTGSYGRVLVKLEYKKRKTVITLTNKMRPKHPSESLTTLTDLVLPSETNPLNNLWW
jgi:hypothetical protein